jgi:DNA replication and repair protein RecF
MADVWEEQLIVYGSEIIKKRKFYIDKINTLFMGDFFVSSNRENYSVKYSRDYSESDSLEEHLAIEFARKRERERLLGYTLVGPHRDDLKFYLNAKPAETFASQGQKRSLVISFKTAQILDYKAIQGHYPVLILDDMSSELDKNRKNALLENLLQNSGQVFITATDFLKTNLSERSNLFRVNNGEISLAD